jgi:hypothetical protein
MKNNNDIDNHNYINNCNDVNNYNDIDINNNNNNYDIDINNNNNNNYDIDISTQFEEIKNLSKKFDVLFDSNSHSDQSNTLKPIKFNYNFKKELANGFIEYKRTLTSYMSTNKADKLIRQIYWRIYEGLVTDNVSLCYYIIGIEDSGKPSYLNDDELINSVNFVLLNVKDSEIKCSYLYLLNTETNYKFAVVKFWIDSDVKKIEYF